VLCTSRANVERFGEVLRKQTDHRILAQGDRDTGRLAEEFVADETSVLVGTRSFWAGIDAAGAACVLVVIDKIPFPVPDEPLHAARRRRAEERELNAFVTVDVPAAALILAQGAGRLIRRNTDRGVVAVLDSRLATKDYRVQLLDAVPPLRRSIDLAETCAFLEEAAKNAPAAAQTPESPGPAQLDPRQLRTDLSTADTRAVRNAVACSVCNAELTERCCDEQGTSGFVHEARVAAARL
jgi:ATP-dependent DNA helicase DinG